MTWFVIMGIVAWIGFVQPLSKDTRTHYPRPFEQGWRKALLDPNYLFFPQEENKLTILPKYNINFNDIFFLDDGKHGWIVGDQGTILLTRDGEKWFQVPRVVNQPLIGVCFQDEQNGWAIGKDFILKSVDGGVNWTKLNIDIPKDYTFKWVSNSNKIFTAIGPEIKYTDKPFLVNKNFKYVGLYGGCTVSNGDLFLNGVNSNYKSVREVFPVTGENRMLMVRKSEQNESKVVIFINDKQVVKTDFVYVEKIEQVSINNFVALTDKGIVQFMWPRESENNSRNEFVKTKKKINGLFAKNDVTSKEKIFYAVGDDGVAFRFDDSGRHDYFSPPVSHFIKDESQVFLNVGGATYFLAGMDHWVSIKFSDTSEVESLFNRSDAGDSNKGNNISIDQYGQVKRGNLILTKYRRYPAIWVWLFEFVIFIFLVGDIYLSARKPTGNGGHSDKPVDSPNQDLIKAAPLVSALGAFIENLHTRPPLTIAIEGDWGYGKSSVMRMLKRHLDAMGERTVWFNAWHHQNESELLGALIEDLRQSAAPPWTYLRYYVHLFVERVLKAMPIRSALFFFFSTLLFLFTVNITALGPVEPETWYHLDFAITAFRAVFDNGAKEVQLIVSLQNLYVAEPIFFFAGMFLTWLIIFSLIFLGHFKFLSLDFSLPTDANRFFGFFKDPNQISLKTGIRHRFAREIQQVTKALAPRRLVIFIDDVDRCTPGMVRATFELSNLICESSECFIILGLAKRQALAGLALSYKDLAEQLNHGNAENFAEDFLQKLVHVVVTVPNMKADQIASVATGEKREEYDNEEDGSNNSYKENFLFWVKRLSGLIDLKGSFSDIFSLAKRPVYIDLVNEIFRFALGWIPPILGIFVIWLGSQWLNNQFTILSKSTGSIQGQERSLNGAETPVGNNNQDVAERSSEQERTPGDNVDSESFLTFLISLLLACLVVRLIRHVKVEDSQAFRDEIICWQEWLFDAGMRTPREIKRFRNFIRLFITQKMLKETNLTMNRPSGAWCDFFARIRYRGRFSRLMKSRDESAERKYVAMASIVLRDYRLNNKSILIHKDGSVVNDDKLPENAYTKFASNDYEWKEVEEMCALLRRGSKWVSKVRTKGFGEPTSKSFSAGRFNRKAPYNSKICKCEKQLPNKRGGRFWK